MMSGVVSKVPSTPSVELEFVAVPREFRSMRDEIGMVLHGIGELETRIAVLTAQLSEEWGNLSDREEQLDHSTQDSRRYWVNFVCDITSLLASNS